jgi:hypothetical protein
MVGWAATVFVRKEVRVPENGPHRDKRHDFLGWMLFVVSAAFFMASSIRAGDVVGLLGGVFFLLACVAFLAPYFGPRRG